MKPDYPIIADEDLKIAKLYNMLEGDAGTTSMGRTAVDNQTVRTVFIIRPDKELVCSTYPMALKKLYGIIETNRLNAVNCKT